MYFSSANSTNFAESWEENHQFSYIKKLGKKEKENTNHHYCEIFKKLKLKTMFATMDDATSEKMGLGSPMHQIRAFKNE
jgi:hypothetical protein